MGAERYCILVALAAACALPCPAQRSRARNYQGTPAARASVQQGDKANDSGRYEAAIAAYQKAIALDPDYAHAYEQLIEAQNSVLVMPMIQQMEKGNKPTAAENDALNAKTKALTQRQADHYTALAKQHPDRAVYPWVLAQLYDEDDPVKEQKYCQEAVTIDPKFGPGYGCLAAVASLGENDAETARYQHKLMALEPDNADAAASLAFMLRDNPQAFQAAVQEVVQKFPHADQAAEVLNVYAESRPTDAAQLAAFERLRTQFPPAKFDSSNQGMMEMFAIYDRTDPAKARTLAQEMHQAMPKDKDWTKYAAYAGAMAKAEQEIGQKQTAAALAGLKAIQTPGYGFDMRRKQLLEARALDASGNTGGAYAALLADDVKQPTEEIRGALGQYGEKLGMTPAQVEADVWTGMKKNAVAAIPFSLPSFVDNQPVALAGYKGHVVIVDFFFPNCGPCRQSFPYMQEIAQKYKSRGVKVLAINGVEGQAPFVMPLIRNTGYDFLPLQATGKWCNDVYHVNGFPTTFLIGADGKQYFKPHVYNRLTQQVAEAQIEELLAHGN